MRLELVDIDADGGRVEPVATPLLEDERGSGSGASGLELLPEHVDEVADGLGGVRTRVGPQRLRDLLCMRHSMALQGKVVQELPGTLIEPVARDRSLFGVHDG